MACALGVFQVGFRWLLKSICGRMTVLLMRHSVCWPTWYAGLLKKADDQRVLARDSKHFERLVALVTLARLQPLS